MRLWVVLLIGLLAHFSIAQEEEGSTAELSSEFTNDLEESPAEQGAETESADEQDHTEAEAEVTHDEDDNQEHNEEGEAAEEETENVEGEQTEESPEDGEDVATEDGTEEEAAVEEEHSAPGEESIDQEIEEETEEPATEADETEQPEGSEPVEENTETSDVTGQTEVLPPSIATDVPKTEVAAQAAETQPWTDDFGWTHYPWKKFPITKIRYSRTKDCGCQVKWIKKVYRRRQPKPCVFLAHSSSVNFRRHHHHHHCPHQHVHHRPCRRHRHRHHVFHSKPLRTVQHVVVNHVPKPCFKKPIVRHVNKYHHVRGGRSNHFGASGFAHV